MQDVADAVHVSKQTVSAVINAKPGITEETRSRVLEAIQRLGYRMDLTARSLRTGRTRTVALIVTDVSNPVAGTMARASEELAYSKGYNLVLNNTHDDLAREDFYINSVLERSLDGVMFISARDESTALEKLEGEGIPVVVIDRVPQNYSGPAVVLDNWHAGSLAGEHLAQLGHQRVAHVGGPESVHIARERMAGFRTVIQQQSLQLIDAEPAAGWRIEDGYRATTRLLQRGCAFTALFCAGDQLAIGAMRALREAGRRIPNDISVIGLDDIDLAKYLSPPLTTISQSIAEMAALGVQMLINLVEGRVPAEHRIVIEPRLVARESTAASSASAILDQGNRESSYG
jgi:DNA-binding LacI/PurR family transcriptional regulator